ncbi:hypothetical protein KUW17_18680 [Leisingera aquaemixtae]|uniref:hypothetical protein n=1 Tax=Leisingera aquaemixtae TaxID=1396826 RepID=UPI001C98D1F3|nr:hypothetical protein [Leisingera aquaemixtae]MBY6068775.1 hypothetical protein [Leisingera aquaemixtae]
MLAALPVHAEEVRLKSGTSAELSSSALVSAPSKYGGAAAGNALELTYTVSDSGYSLQRDAQSLCRRFWSRHFNSVKAKLAAAQINSGVRLIDTNTPLVAVKITFEKAPDPGSLVSAGFPNGLACAG